MERLFSCFPSDLSYLPFLVSLLSCCRLLPLRPVVDVSSLGGGDGIRLVHKFQERSYISYKLSFRSYFFV